MPITWWHYTDEATSLNCKFLYPDVLEPVSHLISEEAGQTSTEVSWTTAEEVKEFPIILYAAIILMVVIFAVVIAVQSRKQTSKEYIAEETEVESEETESEEKLEDDSKQEQWLDADGNPIIGND